MTRTNVPVITLTRAGIDPLASEVTGDATANHSFTNDGATWLQFRNSGASTRTVTLKLGATVDGQAVTSRTISVTTGATIIAGPFRATQYNVGGAVGGTMEFDVSHADLKLKAFKLGAP